MDEVRAVDAGGLERAQRRQVEVRGPPARLCGPRQVQRLGAGVVEHAHAELRLDQRRDREAHAGQRVGSEVHGDHLAQTK